MCGVCEMENYKIKVNKTNNQEIQELFFELGFQWIGEEKGAFWSCEHCSGIFANGESKLLYGGVTRDFETYKELTLPQLRDLVVLHRNDVKDATHVDKRVEKIYLTSEKVIYYWQGEWCKSAINKSNDYENYIANSLKPIQPEQGLISGAEALGNFSNSQVTEEGSSNWIDLSCCKYSIEQILDEKDKYNSGYYKLLFRLKPRTIKLELEIPVQMDRQPKVGERCCYIDFGLISGYQSLVWEEDFSDFIDLWWDSEIKAEQAVAALRGIKG